jgi:hypothetical protein
LREQQHENGRAFVYAFLEQLPFAFHQYDMLLELIYIRTGKAGVCSIRAFLERGILNTAPRRPDLFAHVVSTDPLLQKGLTFE